MRVGVDHFMALTNFATCSGCCLRHEGLDVTDYKVGEVY